jgi:hypothetical protein
MKKRKITLSGGSGKSNNLVLERSAYKRVDDIAPAADRSFAVEEVKEAGVEEEGVVEGGREGNSTSLERFRRPFRGGSLAADSGSAVGVEVAEVRGVGGVGVSGASMAGVAVGVAGVVVRSCGVKDFCAEAPYRSTCLSMRPKPDRVDLVASDGGVERVDEVGFVVEGVDEVRFVVLESDCAEGVDEASLAASVDAGVSDSAGEVAAMSWSLFSANFLFSLLYLVGRGGVTVDSAIASVA